MANANDPIVVTGATGNIGSKLILKLIEAKLPVRAVADVLDSNSVSKAFEDARAVFILIPPNAIAPFLETAKT